MTNNKNSALFLFSAPLPLWVALSLAGLSSMSMAQPVTTATAADVTAAAAAAAAERPMAPRNAYAPSLTPVRRQKAAVNNQAYAPIKKQEDQGQIPEVEMFVGESRVFPTPNVGRIAVGNGQIMTAAALDKKEVIVFANGAGTSSLFVWNEDGRYQRIKINIVAGDTSRIAREVAAFLATIPHAKASVVGDKVIVEGDNLSDADLAKIDMLEKRYPQLVNFTNRVGWEQMVMMDVKVVEFPKTELRDIGLKWSAVGGATLGAIWSPLRYGPRAPGVQYTVNIPSTQNGLPITSADGGTGGVPLLSALGVLSGVNLGLNAQLNLLEQNGTASILAEPQLSARNGAKASFLAGGEFPYSVSNINGVTIVFKPYGIKLDVTPKVDRNGVIRATIVAEVSSIDASVTTTAGPALLTRKTDTEFNVRSGETIVLAGLLQRNTSTDIDKVPLLGDVPILGALFRSKRFQNKETELVVFVTPTVVDSQSPGLTDRVARTTDRLGEQMGKQPYLSEPLQPGKAAADFNRTADASRRSDVAPAASATAQAASALPAMPPTRFAGSLLQVAADGTLLREEPSRDSAMLLQLGRGAVVRMDDVLAKGKDWNNWRHVAVGAVEGWIPSNALVPLRRDMMLRPGRRSDPVHVARQGQLLGTQAIASIVMPPQAAVVDPAGGTVPAVNPQRYQVILDGLALRVTPDVNAMTVLQLNSGSLVEALPERVRGYWTAVQVGGKRGWVPLHWLMPVDVAPATP